MLSATPEERQAIGMLPILMLLSNLMEKVQASICFESKEGNDYTLDAGKNESGIYDALKQNCGAYQDEYDDCARWFTSTLDFGKGILGDSVCTLTYHNIVEDPDLCIINTLQDMCKDGTVTGLDIGVITSLTALVLLIGTCIAVCCAKRKCNNGNADEAKALNDEEAPNYGAGDVPAPEEERRGSTRLKDLASEKEEPEQGAKRYQTM